MTLANRILCPTDFSPPAEQALRYAVELARIFDATIVLLHVVPETSYPLRNPAGFSAFPNLRAEIRKSVDDELALVRRKVPDARIELAVREGVPHAEILAAAQEHRCDLVVMATQGRTGLAHVLLGSTAERVVRLAECPVLTLRAKAT